MRKYLQDAIENLQNLVVEQKMYFFVIISLGVLTTYTLFKYNEKFEVNIDPKQISPILLPKNNEPERSEQLWFYDSKYNSPNYVSNWNPLRDSNDTHNKVVPGIVNCNKSNYKIPANFLPYLVSLPEIETLKNKGSLEYASVTDSLSASNIHKSKEDILEKDKLQEPFIDDIINISERTYNYSKKIGDSSFGYIKDTGKKVQDIGKSTYGYITDVGKKVSNVSESTYDYLEDGSSVLIAFIKNNVINIIIAVSIVILLLYKNNQ